MGGLNNRNAIINEDNSENSDELSDTYNTDDDDEDYLDNDKDDDWLDEPHIYKEDDTILLTKLATYFKDCLDVAAFVGLANKENAAYIQQVKCRAGAHYHNSIYHKEILMIHSIMKHCTEGFHHLLPKIHVLVKLDYFRQELI